MLTKLSWVLAIVLVVLALLKVFLFDPAWEHAKDGHKLSKRERFFIQCWVRSELTLWVLIAVIFLLGAINLVLWLAHR